MADRTVEAIGWGLLSYGGPVAKQLQKVSLRVIANSQCSASYPNKIKPTHICTYTPGKDACQVSVISKYLIESLLQNIIFEIV